MNMDIKSQEWLTPSALGEWLGIGRTTVYTLLHDQIPSHRVGRSIRIRRQDLEDWLEANERRPQNKRSS